MKQVRVQIGQNITGTDKEVAVIPVSEIVETVFGNFRNDRNVYKQPAVRGNLDSIVTGRGFNVIYRHAKTIITGLKNVAFCLGNRHRRRSKLVSLLRRLMSFLIIEKNRIEITHELS